MAWFRKRPPEEARAVTDVPWDVGSWSSAPVTFDQALALAPVFAAHRHLGDNISTLPLKAYRKIGDERQPMSALPQFFKLLADDGELPDWLFAAVVSIASRGNAVGLVTSRDGMGFATAVSWLPMSEIRVDDSTYPRSQWFWNGRPLNRRELVHITWFKVPGRTLGLSPIEAYALTITSGLQAMQFGSDVFRDGGTPPGTFKNTEKTISNADADVIKSRLVTAIRAHRPIVYGKDWDYEAVSIPPAQAQLVESLKLTANQVASIYGIAPEEVGGEAANSLTYANEEHRQTTRMDNLRPWLVRLETKFSSWLPERQYVRFNVDAVIRSDLKTRHEVYRIDREIGLANIDELRAYDDLAPLPNGAGQDYAPLSGAAAPSAPPVSQNGNGNTPALRWAPIS